jgi:RNA polymerase sigma factor (TIGR02999 family)
MTGSGGVGNLACAKTWPFRASAGRLERKALFRMETQLHASIAETLDAMLARLATREPGALDALVSATQADLRRIAHRERLAMGGGETLSTTALVNEAYLKLAGSRLPADVDRRLFFGAAARVMRQVLVDHARAAHALKRGSGAVHESLSAAGAVAAPAARTDDLVALDQALDGLAAANGRAAEVVNLRYFAGLGDGEIADLLGVDESTVRRDWIKARGWLFQHLGGEPA